MPIVTISRMYGSGGSEVAEQVAHALGWDLLDNELVDAVAVRLGVSSAEVSAREERVPSLAERFADALSLGVPEAMPAATVAALTGLGVWWIGRRWIWLAVMMVFGLVLILLEDLPDIGDIGGGSAKEQRRLKLERAIARREAILAQLDGRRP